MLIYNESKKKQCVDKLKESSQLSNTLELNWEN